MRFFLIEILLWKEIYLKRNWRNYATPRTLWPKYGNAKCPENGKKQQRQRQPEKLIPINKEPTLVVDRNYPTIARLQHQDNSWPNQYQHVLWMSMITLWYGRKENRLEPWSLSRGKLSLREIRKNLPKRRIFWSNSKTFQWCCRQPSC